MPRNYFWTACVLLFLFAGFGLNGSAHGASRHYRVHVRVTADNDIHDRIASCLSRELRSLGDVDIVDDKPDYEIDAVAITLETEGKRFTGYAMSTSALARFDSEGWSFMVQPTYLKGWKETTSALYFYPLTWVQSGHDIDELCKTVIAAFDTNALEPARKFRQQIEDSTKKK